MASHRALRYAVSVIICCVVLLLVPLSHGSVVPSSPPSNTEDKVQPFTAHQIANVIPTGKQVCTDGTYQHEAKTCCQCAAGQFLVQHCKKSPEDVSCDYCESGKTYNSVPNSINSCHPCTSCLQPNANMQVDKPCTIARDTVCRCKDEHYCDGDGNACLFCLPCDKCGTQGVQTPCTATSNTVCGNSAWLIALIVLVLVAISVVSFGIIWWKKWLCFHPTTGPDTPNDGAPGAVGRSESPEIQLLGAGELTPHLQEMADLIGWKDMKAVALKSNFQPAEIESYGLDHSNDSKEMALHLLMDWVQRMGSAAPEELIQKLKDVNRKGKAEQVAAKVRR